jgi:hypothetical protein
LSAFQRKIWYVREDADVRGVQDAIFAWNIPSLQAELNNIVMFALKMAEDCTGLPQCFLRNRAIILSPQRLLFPIMRKA